MAVRMTRNFLALLAALVCFSLGGNLRAASALQFAGARLTPGKTILVNVPLNAEEKGYASKGGNTPPTNAVAALAVPPGFNPKKPWPVLVVLATDDFQRRNRDDLSAFYRDTALAEGWVVIAGDGAVLPRSETAAWRLAMTLAALDAFFRSFPGSVHWPLVCAGFSGGAKSAGFLAPVLSLAGANVAGIFITGINADRLSAGYNAFKPGPAFLHTPVFLSSGSSDPIAKLSDQRDVQLSMRKTGFDRIEMEIFPEGHVFKRAHLRDALRWFRQLMKRG
jgi:hypothetical protein